MYNLKVESDNKENPNLDYYYWNKNDKVQTVRKVIDRATKDKRVFYEYWNGQEYVNPKWFEEHNLSVPEIPLFYITNYEEFTNSKSNNIVIVEGEKDVETLNKFNIKATTLNSGNSRIKEDQLNELNIFENKKVYLIGDNDVTGNNYLDDLAYKLFNSGYPVKITRTDIKKLWQEVPDKGDITDWINFKENSGISSKEIIKELITFFESQPEYEPPLDSNFKYRTAEEILKLDIPPIEWLVEDLIPDQGLIQLAGAPKCGKSTFAIQLSSAITLGKTFLDKEVKQGKVVYIDFENSDRTIKGRLKKELTTGNSLNNNLIFMNTDINSEIKSLNEGFLDQIDTYLKKMDYDVALVVIDTLKHIQSSNSTNVNLHDTKEIQKLSKYSQEHKIPFLLLNHTPKESATDGRNIFERSMGSQSVFGAMDTQMILRQNRNENRKVENTSLYITGREVEEQAYILNMAGGQWTSSGSLSEYLDKVAKNKLLNSNIGFGIYALVNRLEENEYFKGTSSELIKKIKSIPVTLDKDEEKSTTVTKYMKDNKLDLERLFECSIEEIDSSSNNSKKWKIRKPINISNLIKDFSND